MAFKIEELEGLKRKVVLEVTSESIQQGYEKELKRYTAKARIPGFRAGKVPRNILEQHYGAQARGDAIQEEMQKSFVEFLKESKVRLAGRPTLLPSEDKEENKFTFAVEFEVYPEFELKDLDKIEVTRPVVSVENADIDRMIKVLQKQQATWEESQEPAVNENRITFDFEGFVDGEAFEGGKAENFVLELGQGRMIPGFEEQILNHKAGEEFDIDVTFPEEYQAENLKGKQARFAIKLKKVEQAKLPEINEKFVKKFGKITTEEELRAEINKNMSRELKNALRTKIKMQVLEGLLAHNEILLPTAFVEDEINILRNQAQERFGAKNKDIKKLPNELFAPEAERRVRVGLILSKLIESQKLEVNEDLVQEMIKDIATAYEDQAEVIAHYNNNKELLDNIRGVALEQQAIEKVLEIAKVTDKPQTFEELMQG